MSAVTVSAVHGLVPAAEMSQVVGLGVCAAPIEMPDFKKPPMVVLVRDLASVTEEGDDHARQVPIDGDLVSMVCALDHVVAQELSVVLERLADRIRRSDEHGTATHAPRDFAVYVPEEMRWTALRLTLDVVHGQDRPFHVAVFVMDDRIVAMLGEDACQKLQAQIARRASQVRRTQG